MQYHKCSQKDNEKIIARYPLEKAKTQGFMFLHVITKNRSSNSRVLIRNQRTISSSIAESGVTR